MAETPMRFVRISEDKWQKGKTKAKRQGTNMSAVINLFVDEYISDDEPIDVEIQRIVSWLENINNRLKGV